MRTRPIFLIPPSPEGPLSEVDVTLKQIPTDYDLRRKDLRERALQELDKLIRLKREGSLDEKEFLLLKKMLLKKVSGWGYSLIKAWWRAIRI